jgi:RNA polymerase sigma-70 factor (ECF subfamily)
MTTTNDWLADRFEQSRPRLRAVAYRMLGSLGEAEDAVQESWVRLSRSDADAIDNLDAWLTTVVGRVCLNMLRSRQTRREESFETYVNYVPDPIVSDVMSEDPEQHALLADAVGLALQVVLETLSPTERVAFVLHDMFAVPFDEIAPMIERTPAATRQLASRARRRVEGAGATPDTDVGAQRELVDAFLAAAKGGDLNGLLSILDPDVILRADGGPPLPTGMPRGALLQGAELVAQRAMFFARFATGDALPVLVNGAAGVLTFDDDEPFSLMTFTVRDGRITHMVALADQERLRALELSSFRP